jgi:Cof subfamily protein (haloacid dehalogenase superfamily)
MAVLGRVSGALCADLSVARCVLFEEGAPSPDSKTNGENVDGPSRIRLVIADVDGTLVTPEKKITDRTRAAVRKLAEANITFAITSGRPPRGMRMLVEPLGLKVPISGFNGGMFVDPDMTPLEAKVIPPEYVGPIIRSLIARGLDAWIYQGNDWLLRDATAFRVEREKHNIQFDPIVTSDLESHVEGVVKIVGVSMDTSKVEACEDEARQRFGDRLSAARSTSFYLDITHPDANKGAVCRRFAKKLGLERDEIATIGDMPNDVLMFACCDHSIAMGQSSDEVKRAARHVTKPNTEDGFAFALENYVLRGAESRSA